MTIRGLSFMFCALAAAAGTAVAEEQVLTMDLSTRPEKIEEIRTPVDKKSETVDYLIPIPSTGGQDFQFQCRLKLTYFGNYAAVAVGLAQSDKMARRVRLYFRKGDGNLTLCGFALGNALTPEIKPFQKYTENDFILNIGYSGKQNELNFKVSTPDGKMLYDGTRIPFRGGRFAADRVVVSVVDSVADGAAYLNYDAAGEQLTGQSFNSEKNRYYCNFALDDILITYSKE
ncbi:hypothetical protein SDC9_101337 [bioreactor metagenome]|uniref:Uncharacterized protein n=1 Tax=bioreactor metagenome TaxID=1076179 RepID=A0A645AN02_9ZZZZ